MDVDVNLRRRQLDEENRRRACVAGAARIRLAERIGDRRRRRGPSVHEDILVAPCRRGEVRAFDQSRDAHVRGVAARVRRVRAAERQHFGEEVVAEEVADALAHRRRRREAVEFASVDRERESDAGMGEGMRREDRLDVGLLRHVGAQELASRGHVAEEVAHLDARAGRTPRRAHLGERARVDLEERALVGVGAARRDREARDGRDRGDCLAPEAERVDRLDVRDVADLRRRLAFEREERVVLRHAAAVVLHGDKLASALRDRDGDARRARVEGVLDEFLDDARGPLDDFARRDLVRDVERQDAHVAVAVRSQGSAPFG